MRLPLPGFPRLHPLGAVFTLLPMLACSCSPSVAAPTQIEPTLDEDGVQKLFPSAPGATFRLGNENPNTTPHFTIEHGTLATPGSDGCFHFWHLPSYALTYASGGRGWTSRLHIHASGGLEQRYTWKTQHGYLLNPDDLKNQEVTVFLRVHGLVDPRRARVTVKIRGGAHITSAPERSSCVMLTFAPASHGSVTRFGKELTHPEYDYKTLTRFFPAALQENIWVGLKLVSWNAPQDPRHVINRLYLDTDPFDAATGTPGNHWRLFSEYVDSAGTSTGRYNRLVDWGGWQTTLRTDGFDSIDFTWPSAREIIPY